MKRSGSRARAVRLDELMTAVPHVNKAAERRRLNEGGEIVTVPMRKPGFMVPPISWVLPFSSERRVELDPVGVSVLELCDGRRSVERIVDAFAERHQLSFREAQVPVVEFMRQLTERGIVALVGPKSGRC